MAATPATTTHNETASTSPSPKPRPSVWKMMLAGFGFALLLLVVGLVSYWYFGGAEDRFVDPDAKRVEYRQKVLADRVSEDDKYLKDQPGWFDQKKGLVRVPIQEAITMTIPTLLADKPHPAYPLSQSLPQPAAVPTGPAKGGNLPASDKALNPTSSNPTVGQPSPAPVAAAPAPQSPVAKSSPVPVAPAAQNPTPESSVAPTTSPTAAAPTPPTANPAPAPTATPPVREFRDADPPTGARHNALPGADAQHLNGEPAEQQRQQSRQSTDPGHQCAAARFLVARRNPERGRGRAADQAGGATFARREQRERRQHADARPERAGCHSGRHPSLSQSDFQPT